MVIMNGCTNYPHRRQNRRRERPGSRARRTIRKPNLHNDYAEGLEFARDTSLPLPSDKARPSPLHSPDCLDLDQSWQRWKAEQAEGRALADVDNMQLVQEQFRLFGGDADDDELFRLGILYNGEDEGVARDAESNIVSRDVPIEQILPMFVLRKGKPRRSRRRPARPSLSFYFSFTALSDDTDIARLLCPSTDTPTIQHRDMIPTFPLQSLPATSAFSAVLGSSHSHSHSPNTISISPPSLFVELHNGDWTFINAPAAHSTPRVNTPSSEPETWILLGDDS